MSTVQDRVRKIVVEQLGVKEDELTNDASFVDDLGADSLDTVELVMALEEEFETEIPDEKAEKITTIQEAINYIESNLEDKQMFLGYTEIPVDSLPVKPNGIKLKNVH